MCVCVVSNVNGDSNEGFFFFFFFFFFLHIPVRTAEFGECQCRGEGANREHRVPWSRSYTFLEAQLTLTTEFIFGQKWLDPFATSRYLNDHS